ncbi:MAG: hypothetical protein LBS01_06600 [Prevotellaceae bacterium]|jgi:hypothetical protein|nr:hypothetical protein [Prevotellaceae bacterium]
MHISIRRTVNPSILLAVVWIAGCLLLWIAPSKLPQEFVESREVLPVLRFLQTILPVGCVIANLLCVLLTIVNSVLLYQLNNVFTLIREKTFLLPLIFIILISSFHSTHYNIAANLSLMFLLIAFFNFLKMYHKVAQTEAAFLGSLLIACVGWLFFPEFLLLFVAVWLGLSILRAMSIRVFLATLIGLVTPPIFCFVFYRTYFGMFVSYFKTMFIERQLFLQHSLDFQVLFFLSVFMILWALSLIGIFTDALRNTIRTRINLNFVLLFFIIVLCIIIGFPQTIFAFLPLISALFAVFFAHPVSLKNSNFFNIIFIIFCITSVIYVLSNVIANYL